MAVRMDEYAAGPGRRRGREDEPTSRREDEPTAQPRPRRPPPLNGPRAPPTNGLWRRRRKKSYLSPAGRMGAKARAISLPARLLCNAKTVVADDMLMRLVCLAARRARRQ